MATVQVTYAALDDDAFEYSMRRRDRGIAYIINNYQFDKLEPRPFSGIDRDALIGALKFVGFKDRDIQHFDNQTAHQMECLMEEAAKQDYSRKGCLFVAILTHGDEETLWGTDRVIGYQQLMQPLKIASMRNLDGIPKVLIVQACKQNCRNPQPSYNVQPDPPPRRSTVGPPKAPQYTMMEVDAFIPAVDGDLSHDAEVAGSATPYCTSPQSDFLIAYSVLPGTDQGSRFIQAFCEVMRKDGRKLEATKLLAHVSRIMSYTPGTSMPNKSIPHPCVISQLRKELYFS